MTRDTNKVLEVFPHIFWFVEQNVTNLQKLIVLLDILYFPEVLLSVSKAPVG